MSHPPRSRAIWWTARLGLAGVTILAAIASYLHALPVVQAADGPGEVSYFIPVLADLLIATATANVIDAHRSGERWPRVSLVAIVVAIGMTVTFNVADGSPHAVPPWLVNVWPPVAFVLALESFMGHLRRGRGALSPSIPGVPPATLPTCGHVVGDPAGAIRVAVEHARECLDQKVIIRELARQTGIDHRKLSKLAAPATEDSPAGVALAPVSAQPPPPGGAPAGATMNAQPPRRGWASTPPPPAVPATQSPNGQHAEGR